MAIRYADALELRAPADGALIARLPAPAQHISWWKLASDGSYVVVGTNTAITAWSSAGVQLFVRNGTYLDALAFAAAGELRIARSLAGAFVIERVTVPGGASTAAWFEINASGQPIRLAPNGAAHAVSSEGLTPNSSTRIFVNGVLSTAANGWAVGWLDDNRLLVNRFRFSSTPPAAVFDGSVILDSAGQTVATPALPQMDRMQPLPSNRLYSPRYNQIFDVANGAVLWTSAAPAGPQQGAASEDFVVFASGATVRADLR
jgi:hypothetical protein